MLFLGMMAVGSLMGYLASTNESSIASTTARGCVI